MVLLFYTTYISVDLAHHEIFRAEVGKGGIKKYISFAIQMFIVNRALSERWLGRYLCSKFNFYM